MPKGRKKNVLDGSALPLVGINTLEKDIRSRRKITRHEIETIEPKKLQVEVNRLNRDRAKAMERRIAKRLQGNRVLMSGAGYIKGDVTIPYKGSSFLIECKLTENTKKGTPQIGIPYFWLTKIERETKAMRSLFGVLIIHFHGVAGDYVFMPVDKLYHLEMPIPLPTHIIDFTRRESTKEYATANIQRPLVLEPVEMIFPRREKGYVHNDCSNPLRYFVYELETFIPFLAKA
jgi:hypothetical protein